MKGAMESATEIRIVKRGRGRPKGKRDTKPRQRREGIPIFEPGLNVGQKMRLIPHPIKAREVAEILGLSTATIMRRAKEGTLPHFRSRGMIRFEPMQVLDWYLHRCSDR